MKQPRDTKAALIYRHLVATGGTTAVGWRGNTGGAFYTEVFPPSDWPQFFWPLTEAAGLETRTESECQLQCVQTDTKYPQTQTNTQHNQKQHQNHHKVV